ncbi:MAG: hypothetical protein U9N41_06530 [Euryarchaeota archaeon]|nr:hypothetical protein [Euryarchaeota archaeon]
MEQKGGVFDMGDSPVEYIKKVYEKWKRCPICGSEDGFEVKRYFLVKCRLVCKACSAEWIPYIEDEPKGEINGMMLLKPDLDGKAARYELDIHPPEWWVGVIFHINVGHFNTPLFRLCLTIYSIFDYKLR